MSPRVFIAAVPLALLAACAGLTETRQHMVQAPAVGGLAEETFGQAGWGRRGEFQLYHQRVRYGRDAEQLSLFEPLGAGGGTRTPLRYTWSSPAGDSVAGCAGWSSDATANSKLAAEKPWVLSCRWSGASDATLQIGEGQMRRGKLTREGAYQRGELTVGLRSVHLLEGDVQPQAAGVGYEFMYQGQVVGSLDLAGGAPRLRRPDPATPLGRAVTEAALALALVSDPITTR